MRSHRRTHGDGRTDGGSDCSRSCAAVMRWEMREAGCRPYGRASDWGHRTWRRSTLESADLINLGNGHLMRPFYTVDSHPPPHPTPRPTICSCSCFAPCPFSGSLFISRAQLSPQLLELVRGFIHLIIPKQV